MSHSQACTVSCATTPADRQADLGRARRVLLHAGDLAPDPFVERGAQLRSVGIELVQFGVHRGQHAPRDRGAQRPADQPAALFAHPLLDRGAQRGLLARPAATSIWPRTKPKHLLVPAALDQAVQRARHDRRRRRRRPGCAARSARPRAAPGRPPPSPAAAAAWRRAPRPPAGADCGSVEEAVQDAAAGRAAAARRPTSAGVNTWLATNRPSARPSRSFCVGMIAVCGIGRPSGWRNSAVTANQSAMPPTNPALAAACRMSVHHPGARP